MVLPVFVGVWRPFGAFGGSASKPPRYLGPKRGKAFVGLADRSLIISGGVQEGWVFENALGHGRNHIKAGLSRACFFLGLPFLEGGPFVGVPLQQIGAIAARDEGACPLAVLADKIALCATVILGLKQGVTCLGAKMRDIDDRCGIIGAQAHAVTHGQGGQPLPQFKHGQRAQQPGGIKVMNGHECQISQMLHRVHRVVTIWRVTGPEIGSRGGVCLELN